MKFEENTPAGIFQGTASSKLNEKIGAMFRSSTDIGGVPCAFPPDLAFLMFVGIFERSLIFGSVKAKDLVMVFLTVMNEQQGLRNTILERTSCTRYLVTVY